MIYTTAWEDIEISWSRYIEYMSDLHNISFISEKLLKSVNSRYIEKISYLHNISFISEKVLKSVKVGKLNTCQTYTSFHL